LISSLSLEEENSLVRLAYQSVEQVETVERGDRNRLGYFVWLFLRGEISTLEEAVAKARSRFKPRGYPVEQVLSHIKERLEELRSQADQV